MSLEQALTEHLAGLVEAIAKKVAAEIVAVPNGNVRAMTRRKACQALGIGQHKLRELIRTGVIKTVAKDPRLIPLSEVERYAEPTQRKEPRRRSQKMPDSHIQDSDSLREALRESR